MATCSGIDTNIISCEGGGDAGIWSMLSLVINIFTAGVGILAVTGIVLFGIQYITSAGDTAKAAKAKRRLIEIVIGLAAYFTLWGIFQWLVPGGVFHEMGSTDSVSLTLNNSYVYVGETTSVTVKVYPESASDKTFSLASSDKNIATVSSGVIRCVRAGNATITATTVDSKTSSATIYCQDRPIDVEPEPDNDQDDDYDDDDTEGLSSKDPKTGKIILTIEDRALTEEEVRKYKFDVNPTYADIVTLAKQYNLQEKSDKLVAVMSWVHGEGYWSAKVHPDSYLAYLCAVVIINNVTKNMDYSNPLRTMAGWGDWYSPDNVRARAEYAKTYLPSLKPLYLAFRYPRSGIWNCYGENNSKRPTIYTGLNNKNEKIYVY